MSSRAKGYAYALMATLMGSLVYLFSKAALNEVSLPQFGIYWFAMAIFWNLLYSQRRDKHIAWRKLSAKSYRRLLVIGFFEVVATVALYTAIARSANPAIPSFLRNLEYLFVMVFGILILAERLGWLETLGAVLILTGAFVIGWKEQSWKDLLTGATGLMFLSTVFYAIRTLTVKKSLGEITPVLVALNRAVYLFITFFIAFLAMRQSIVIPLSAFVNIAIGSFVGPFLTSVSQYSALKYLEASRLALVQSTTGLFVLVGAWLMFGNWPAHVQLMGGLLTIFGASLLIIGRRNRPA